ncbi:hypothetical protein M3Y97_00775700 [Aphelenchoides bicaudatus]|nr:hypothetical protein M3Y97_00775700 [Aphelenchoides bicaudatus]
MSSYDSDNELNTSPLYKDRPEWKDVTPIYNSADEDAVVKIAHSETFTDAFAYFRAILHQNEMSERAFELTTTCSQLNAANYSVWQFRRNLLKSLNKNTDDEFRFTEEMIFENPKNYQIWHHLDLTKDPKRELEFTESVLRGDAKNYHGWQHRQWVVYNFNLFSDNEVEYSTQLLAEDLRNNSAWNYRYFIIDHLSDTFKKQDVVANEIEFAKQAIQKLNYNESSWSYLNGLLVNDGLSAHPEIISFLKNLHETGDTRSVHLRCLLFDYHTEQIEKSNEVKSNSDLAFKLLDELEEIDSVRKNYYGYLRDRVNNLLSG